jgi:aquaporin Z
MLRDVQKAARENWPEYLMEAAGLAIILFVSAAITVFAQTVPPSEWPGLPRRMLEGLVIAGTAVTLVYSPWGLRSGAHYNPAVTITFFALGRVKLVDAAFYVLFQSMGAVVGILVAGLLIGTLLTDPPTTWIVTQPGSYGILVALASELAIACLTMGTILTTGGRPFLARFTGVFAGVLIFLYVSFEAPLSGFSMNPARSFGSAVVSGYWAAFWIYVFAPPAGMLAAAGTYRLLSVRPEATCAKIVRNGAQRCIHCGFVPGTTTTSDRVLSCDPAGRLH